MKGIATKIQVDMRDDEDVLKEFHKLDLNEAELLNPEEIKAVFDNLIPAPPPAQVKRITEAFNVFDADGDGVWRIVFERTGNHTTIYGQIFWSKIGCPHINEYAR
ncbi:unnamed protein product [Orchesella dallaii]|uniref:Uncharacterized protein n=1 Tax=Orchesella dallaii TaxID=48710 RepID=A0ABP1QN90_9HEXA